MRAHNGVSGSQSLVPLFVNNFNSLVEISSQLNVPGPSTPEIDLPSPAGCIIRWVAGVGTKRSLLPESEHDYQLYSPHCSLYTDWTIPDPGACIIKKNQLNKYQCMAIWIVLTPVAEQIHGSKSAEPNVCLVLFEGLQIFRPSGATWT